MTTDDEDEQMNERIQEIESEIFGNIVEVIKTLFQKYPEPASLQAVAAALSDLSVAYNADILREEADTEGWGAIIDNYIKYYRGCLEVAVSRPPVGHPPVTH